MEWDSKLSPPGTARFSSPLVLARRQPEKEFSRTYLKSYSLFISITHILHVLVLVVQMVECCRRDAFSGDIFVIHLSPNPLHRRDVSPQACNFELRCTELKK